MYAWGLTAIHRDLGESGRTICARIWAAIQVCGVRLTSPAYLSNPHASSRARRRKPSPRGHLRAYDVRTGPASLAFHTIRTRRVRPSTHGRRGLNVRGARTAARDGADERRGLFSCRPAPRPISMRRSPREQPLANSLLPSSFYRPPNLAFSTVRDVWYRASPPPPTWLRCCATAAPSTRWHRLLAGFFVSLHRTNGHRSSHRDKPVPPQLPDSYRPAHPLPVLTRRPFARQRLTERR